VELRVWIWRFALSQWKVLRIGGLREKTVAAGRCGYKYGVLL